MGVFRGVVALLLALGACGGDDDDESGEPLISGSMTGEWDGSSFTPANGFAGMLDDIPTIGVGDGPLQCNSFNESDAPSGSTAAMVVPDFVVGDYENVLVGLYHNVAGDPFESYSTSAGSVSITESTDAAIAGSVSYDTTDDDGRHFALSGSFEVVRCQP